MTDTDTPQTPSAQITAEVEGWEGVTSGYGRRGEFAFKLNGGEIGHLHGDHVAHFFFAPEQWGMLYAEGRIGFHPVVPDRRGPAARRIEGGEDVQDVIRMMRLNYERIAARGAARAA
jgi:hypothetical protein